MIEWRKINDFPNYEISATGDVKSLGRIRLAGNKPGGSFYKERMLRPSATPDGYLYLELCNDLVYKNFRINRLVAMMFIPNPLSLPEVNHINSDRRDNRVENLEWCTRSENMKHAFKNGLVKPPPRTGMISHLSGRAKPILQLTLKGDLVKEWVCGADVQRHSGLRASSITRCANHQRKSAFGFKWEFK